MVFSSKSDSKGFGKGDAQPETGRAAPAKAEGAPSIISANLHIIGNMSTAGEIQVDGTVDGDIQGNSVVIGANATVNGQISADDVSVRGTINGRIDARKVELASTARINGDILHEVLAVDAGAYLEGNCKRRDSVAKEKPAAVPKPAVSGAAPAAGEAVAAKPS